MNFDITKKSCDEINNYVLSCPKSLIYSCPDFLNLISGHLGATPYWMVAWDDSEIQALLPFLQSRVGQFGTVLNSLAYYGSNGGVLQKNGDELITKKLIEEFFNHAKTINACSATIITNPLLEDHLIYESSIKGFIRDERIGQITHLPENPEDELLTLFEDPRPRNIRRAIKEGIQVTSGNERISVEFLYQIHVDNMKAIGGLSKTWDFFEKLLSDMPRDLWSVYVGSKEDQPIAALLLFYFNGTVEYFTPVIISEYRNTQALALVIYEAMIDAVSRKGCKNWNWGGTWLSQGGVYDFKKRWGTTDYPYYYYTKLFNEEVKSSSKDTLLKDYPGFFRFTI